MQDSDDVIYYELPPFTSQDVILHLYSLVDNISKIVPQLTCNPSFEEDNIKLKAKMHDADPEFPLLLTYVECLVMCEMMNVIKFYYKHAVLPNTEGKDNLTEQEIASREMYDEVMRKVTEITDDIFSVFTPIKEVFYHAENEEKKKKDEAKTLGLNKKKKIIYITLAHEALQNHIFALFGFFDWFIVHGTSNFSERVREMDFYCITEIKETKEMFEKGVRATKRNKKRETLFSLRDVVVILMINHLFQKAYFSDGGDEIHSLFECSTADIKELAVEDVRNHMLKMAKNFEEDLYKLEEQVVGLKEAMQPIFNFPV